MLITSWDHILDPTPPLLRHGDEGRGGEGPVLAEWPSTAQLVREENVPTKRRGVNGGYQENPTLLHRFARINQYICEYRLLPNRYGRLLTVDKLYLGDLN